MKVWYYMIYNHNFKESLPSGLVDFERWASRPYLQTIEHYCFGKCSFDHVLSMNEMSICGLVPVPHIERFSA